MSITKNIYIKYIKTSRGLLSHAFLHNIKFAPFNICTSKWILSFLSVYKNLDIIMTPQVKASLRNKLPSRDSCMFVTWGWTLSYARLWYSAGSTPFNRNSPALDPAWIPWNWTPHQLLTLSQPSGASSSLSALMGSFSSILLPIFMHLKWT